jgi:serine/threonine protein kinase
MATVYRAYDQRLQRIVALKILHEHLTSDPDLTLRFNQEAKLAARIDHPNVVRIYDIGVNKQNQLFIVSEFVDGQSLTLALRQYMNRANPYLNPILAALVGHEIARGMSAAHNHLVVHRDLKPDNVLVSNSGNVKLTDFGVARPFDSSMTQAGQFIGSLTYASPEQVSGTKVDTRSDIFSFGVILFELLTGQLPFRSTNPTDLAIKITQAQIPPLNQLRASIPLELDAVVRKCLRANPAERPQNADQIVHDLAHFLVRNEVTVSPQMIHDGFKNPSLFNSTIRRSPLAGSESEKQEGTNAAVITGNEIGPRAQAETIPQVAADSPSQILELQQPTPVAAPVQQPTPVAAPVQKPPFIQRSKAGASTQRPRSPTAGRKSNFPFFSLLAIFLIIAAFGLALKNRESIRQFLDDSREPQVAQETKTPQQETLFPPLNPTESQPALQNTVNPAPTLSPATKTPTPLPSRTAAHMPSSAPAPKATHVPPPNKHKLVTPAPRPTRQPVKQKTPAAQPTKAASKTKPATVAKNVSPDKKTSTLIVKTNPGEIPIFLVYPNSAPEFLGLSFNNKERVFSSVKSGTVIVRAEPGDPNNKSFDSRERRITLIAGQRTEVTINLPTLVKVTVRCPNEVKITKVNARTAQHRGGEFTFNAPLNETVQIEAVNESRGRSSARIKISKAGQILDCPFEFRRDR